MCLALSPSNISSVISVKIEFVFLSLSGKIREKLCKQFPFGLHHTARRWYAAGDIL